MRLGIMSHACRGLASYSELALSCIGTYTTVSDNLSQLMHQCTGSDCSYCTWRKDNPIELGWERLLETPESDISNLCGVDLTCTQVDNPHHELSTQQIADF